MRIASDFEGTNWVTSARPVPGRTVQVPTCIAPDTNNRIYVTQIETSGSCAWDDMTGTNWVTCSAAAGKAFVTPYGIRVDSSSHVYVSDEGAMSSTSKRYDRRQLPILEHPDAYQRQVQSAYSHRARLPKQAVCGRLAQPEDREGRQHHGLKSHKWDSAAFWAAHRYYRLGAKIKFSLPTRVKAASTAFWTSMAALLARTVRQAPVATSFKIHSRYALTKDFA